MKLKNIFSYVLIAVMALSLAAITAFADGFYEDIPSDATVYGAGTCHHGFTTSRYLSRGSGWNDTIQVSATYVLWDDMWEYDMYELVHAKNGNAQLSDNTIVYTGLYNPQPGGVVMNPGTDRSNYTPYTATVSLYDCVSNYSKLYLRIDKPDDPNYANGTDAIDNMQVWGYFWK